MKQETPASNGKTGDEATLHIVLILLNPKLHTLRRYFYTYSNRILLCAVPPLSRESRCVKHDPGRSPDFRSFGVACKPKLVLQIPLNLPISKLTVVFSADICDRSQWRGRGGFSPRFPILRNSAPEPLVYSNVMHILYRIATFFANLLVKGENTNKKFDNADSMWYYLILVFEIYIRLKSEKNDSYTFTLQLA